MRVEPRATYRIQDARLRNAVPLPVLGYHYGKVLEVAGIRLIREEHNP